MAARAFRPFATQKRRASTGSATLPPLRIVLGILGVTLAVVGGYAIARETSIFAVRQIDVSGGSPRVQAQVRHALEPELGKSLVATSAGDVTRLLARLPDVNSVTVDRSFPHTLHVTVEPQKAGMILRQGAKGWVISLQGRVLRPVHDPRKSSLPRVWVKADATVAVGNTLSGDDGALAASALAAASHTPLFHQVQTVRASDSELTLVLHSGFEIRLGDGGNLRLKLAIARQVLHVLGPTTTDRYVDVGVPERPVAGGG